MIDFFLIFRFNSRSETSSSTVKAAPSMPLSASEKMAMLKAGRTRSVASEMKGGSTTKEQGGGGKGKGKRRTAATRGENAWPGEGATEKAKPPPPDVPPPSSPPPPPSVARLQDALARKASFMPSVPPERPPPASASHEPPVPPPGTGRLPASPPPSDTAPPGIRICGTCGLKLPPGEPSVTIAGTPHHKACAVCADCKIDLTTGT